MQRRVHHNIQLAARCAHLEAQKQALEAEQAQLSTKLDKAQVSCAAPCPQDTAGRWSGSCTLVLYCVQWYRDCSFSQAGTTPKPIGCKGVDYGWLSAVVCGPRQA